MKRSNKRYGNHQLAATLLGIRHHCRSSIDPPSPPRRNNLVSNSVAGHITHILFDATASLYAPAGEKTAKANYKSVEASVSFTYAAATIQLDSKTGFFSSIFDLVKKDLDYASICANWFARTLYASHNLIIDDDGRKKQDLIRDLPQEIDVQEFDVPDSISHAKDLISDLLKPGAIARYNKAGGRESLLEKHGIFTVKSKLREIGRV